MSQAANPFRCFNSSPEVIRLVVMMYVRFPLSLRNVEDLLFERGIDICHETVRFWWNRFGPMFAAEIRRRRVKHTRGQDILQGYDEWKRAKASAAPTDEESVVRLKNVLVNDSHTAEEVPALAIGPGADKIRGYFANTHLFSVMLNAWGWVPDQAASE